MTHPSTFSPKPSALFCSGVFDSLAAADIAPPSTASRSELLMGLCVDTIRAPDFFKAGRP